MTDKEFNRLVTQSKKIGLSKGAEFMTILAGYRIFKSINDKEVFKYQAYASGLSAQAIISGNHGYYVVKKRKTVKNEKE